MAHGWRRDRRAGRVGRGLIGAAAALVGAALLAPASSGSPAGGGVGSPATATAAAASARFGQTEVGPASDRFAANRKRVNRYTLPAAGSVTKLSVYLAPTGTSGSQALEGVLYGSSQSGPGALLATTEPITFASTGAAGWYDLPFSSAVKLPAGTYWIGIITGATGSVAGFRYFSVASSRDWNANTYTAGPSNPFGTPTVDGEQASLYATYTPEGAPLAPPANTAAPTISGHAEQGQTLVASVGTWTNEPTKFSYRWQRCEAAGSGCMAIAGAEGQSYTLAQADVGSTIEVAVTASNEAGSSAPAASLPTAVVAAAPSSSRFGQTEVGPLSDRFASERKRVNRYALAVAGSVSKLSVYLAPTGTSGTQAIKGVLYADAGGAPGALLATTEPITFASTGVAGWYSLPFPAPVKLAAGEYWIGVITGATNSVAGFRYFSVSGARDWNANTYASGPTNPFGTPNVDAEQTSLYATYTASEETDTTPPTRPEGLSAKAIGPAQVNLSWQPSTDNVAVAGYTVRRAGETIATVGPGSTTYTDAAVAPATEYSYAVEAFDAAGNRSPASAPVTATTLPSTEVHHWEYVFPSNAIDVYDIDNSQQLVKTIALPAAATDVRGAAASPATGILYVSYGKDSSTGGGGTLLAYDLVHETTLWTHTYPEGVDSMAVSPDGKTIFMPVGEASTASNWDVIEAASGNVVATINGGAGPHNTIVSLDGQHVFMGPRNGSFLTEADAHTDQVIKQVGPLLNGGVRPFTINAAQSLAFTTATSYLGFQVSSITTGQVLYTVPIAGNFPYTPGQEGPSSPSHGITLSPNGRELWVIDQPNSYVHVFDVSGLPSVAPKQIADIKLTRPMTGSQVGCTYDCLREGWLQHTLDGRYVYVGDSGDVISTETRQSIANLEPLYNSRMYLEIDWRGGVPVATSTRSGVGYPAG